MTSVTPEELVNNIYARLAANPELATNFPGSIKFRFNDLDGKSWVITGSPRVELIASDLEADCMIETSSSNLMSICSGEINPQVAYMQGDIKVQGNTDLILALVLLWSNNKAK